MHCHQQPLQPSNTPHPSTVNRWRRVFAQRFVYGQIAREFEKGKFKGGNNTTGRDGGTYRNKNVETMNAITNVGKGGKDGFQTITLCQPQVAYKDHKSVSQRMCFCSYISTNLIAYTMVNTFNGHGLLVHLFILSIERKLIKVIQ